MQIDRGVILDRGSMDRGDIDFTSLNNTVKQWTVHDETSPDDVLQNLREADVAITNKVVINRDVLCNAKKLKLICIAATGTNNVDLEAARENSIAVCNVTGYATESVVQHVFSLMLAMHNNLCLYDQYVRQHKWEQSRHFCLLDFPITQLAGKTLGVIGYGELGKAVASAAKAFGLNVIVAQSFIGHSGDDRVPLKTLFSSSDIISLHCPLSEETRNLINKNTLSLMKQDAMLINTARGPIVNEEDLLWALTNSRIAAAALDVLQKEPPRDNVLINANLPNLIITPHIAWATRSSRQKLINEIASNIEAFKQNMTRNLVN